MGPMQGDVGPIAVEYDAHGRRVRKTFDCPYEARRFFVAKEKAGKNPKVRKGGPTMSDYDRVLEMTDRLSDTERLTLAAELLNKVGVGRDTWRTFADALDDTNHGELLGWAADEPERS